MTGRADELEANLAALHERIARHRDPAEVTLVAVSKTWPASDVLLLHRLGVDDFGENYDQEAAAKAKALADAGVTPRWHFVGHVQRNKARSIASYADVVHGVDRAEVAVALGAAAARAGRRLDALVQVRFDAPANIPALAEEVEKTEGLRLAGVMCVAPLGEPPRPYFARLRAIAERLQRDHPGATTISAGMTGDFEDALDEGANCLRIGTALFGDRPPAVR